MACLYVRFNQPVGEGSAMHLLIFEVGGDISSVT